MAPTGTKRRSTTRTNSRGLFQPTKAVRLMATMAAVTLLGLLAVGEDGRGLLAHNCMPASAGPEARAGEAGGLGRDGRHAVASADAVGGGGTRRG